MRRPIGIVFALSLSAPLSASALALLTQDRSVHADAYLAPSFGTPIVVSETKVSPHFGPFDETANAAAGFAGAGAAQTSRITPLSNVSLQVEATGGESANAFDMMGDNRFGIASANSHFEITFAVDSAVPYDLSARVFGTSMTDPFPASPFREWSARVELLDAGGGFLAQLVGSLAAGDPPAQVDETQVFFGILAPGTYTLRAMADGEAWGDRYAPEYALSYASYELDFSIVPEPDAIGLLLFGLAFVAVRLRTRDETSPHRVEPVQCADALRSRVLERALSKALIVAGLLLVWVAPSAQATGIYWTARTTSSSLTVGRANLDGTGVNPTFIALDPGNEIAVDGAHIYWENGSFIARANLDGTGVNSSFIVVDLGTEITGLAVDGAHIYWSARTNAQGGAPSAIGRANLDGTGFNRTFIAGSAFGLAVDETHLYWATLGGIDRANLDGTGVNRTFITGGSASSDVAVDGTHVYWSNLSTGTIGRANLDGTGVSQSFVTGLNFPGHIAVVPEPATGLLAMLGMLGLAGRRLRARHLLRLAGHWRKS